MRERRHDRGMAGPRGRREGAGGRWRNVDTTGTWTGKRRRYGAAGRGLARAVRGEKLRRYERIDAIDIGMCPRCSAIRNLRVSVERRQIQGHDGIRTTNIDIVTALKGAETRIQTLR